MKWRFADRVAPLAKSQNSPPETLINLGGGFACPDLLPDISTIASHVATHYRQEVMQYSSSFGLDDLRKALAAVMVGEGVKCGRDNILIVNGAKQGLDLVARIFLESGDGVIVSIPSYMSALSIFRNFGADFIAIPQDDEGLDVDRLETTLHKRQQVGLAAPKLLFDVPDFNNPNGITTSLKRRQALLALAGKYNFVIVEDNPYGKIRFEGEAIAPIKSLDGRGRVIMLGTASKILSPGLRLGWVVAEEDMIATMAAHKAEGGTSAYLQRIFVKLLQNGQVAHHIEQSKIRLRLHRDVMMSALTKYLPDVRFRKPEGGYYLWLDVGANRDSDQLATAARSYGVAVYSGRVSDPLQRDRSHLRLCYSYETATRIEEGIEKLSRAFFDCDEASQSA